MELPFDLKSDLEGYMAGFRWDVVGLLLESDEVINVTEQ